MNDLARRISIVLSQSQRPNPTQRDLEGTLVAELLMVHGIEVTLIPDLATLSEGDTGMLCLEGITGDMVLLSWYSPQEAIQHLRQREVWGRLGRTSFDKFAVMEESASHPRTVFAINMAELPTVQRCCEEIQRIREEVTVTTFDLGIPIVGSENTSEPVAKAKQNVTDPNKSQDVASDSSVNHDEVNHDEEESDPDGASLDRLIDQLDAWDT